MVVGLGGVGSFAVEALARSGVGTLSLVDFDRVCVTNTNRQLQAVATSVAKPKATLLAERVRAINPQATPRIVPLFYSARSCDEILGARPDFVVDAIDNVTAKCHLLATCRSRGIPVVSSTGASGRIDPTQIRVVDLAETAVDPLADAVRRALRQKYDFPSKGPFGIAAVYSTGAAGAAARAALRRRRRLPLRLSGRQQRGARLRGAPGHLWHRRLRHRRLRARLRVGGGARPRRLAVDCAAT